MEHSYYYQNGTHQNGTLILLSKWNSSKWNTHIIIKMELIKMEHSYYYQNGTHQNGTLLKMEHSVDLGGHPILRYFAFDEPLVVLYHPVLVWNGTLLISKPWIIVKSLGSSFNDLLKTIKTIFNNIVVSFSLTQGSPPPPDLDFGLCARVSQWFDSTLSPRSLFHTRQRFPLPNHVTSGCMSPRSLFSTGQRFPKSRDFR